MPMYPLFVVAAYVALLERMTAMSVLFLGLSILAFDGKRIGTQIGVVTLLIVMTWQTYGDPPSFSSNERVDIMSRSENGERSRIRAESERGTFLLIGRKIDAAVEPGRTCVVLLKRVPFSQKRNVGGFDESAWARGSGIDWKAEIERVDRCEDTPGFSGGLLRFKERRLDAVETTYERRAALYIEALLFGESRMIDEDTSFQYQMTGLLHLLVISGSHIALLVYALNRVFRPLPLLVELKLLLIIVIVTLFGALTSFSPPVLRAVIIADAVLLANVFRVRIHDRIEALAWCGACMLACFPHLAFNLGFQLTLGMTLCLLLTAFLWEHVFIYALYMQLVGLMLLWNVQGVISPFAPLLNVVFGWGMTWVLFPLTIATYVIPRFEPLLLATVGWTHRVFQWMEGQRFWVALPELGDVLWWGLAIGLCVGTVMMERYDWKRGVACQLAVCLVVYVIASKDVERLTFLDVGQGDAAVVEVDGVVGVIDTGGVYTPVDENRRSVFDPGRDIVVPYLWKRGVREIDFLLVTHADNDHAGGVEGVLRSIDVRELWLSERHIDEEKRGELVRLAARYGTSVRLFSGTSLPYPWLLVIAPLEGEEENELSMVTYIRFGGMTALLTGDLPKEQERRLAVSDVDVLKLGHHGAKNSTDASFLKRVDPKWVIISVGENNRYGHPAEETMEQITSRRVLRTDQDHMIRCEKKECVPYRP